MSNLIKLIGWFILGALFNIMYAALYNIDSSNGATAIQLFLFIIAWVVVEIIYSIRRPKNVHKSHPKNNLTKSTQDQKR